MKLWIGTETQSDIYDYIRVVRTTVEERINAHILGKKYGIALDEWDCIIILRDDDDFEEIIDYDSNSREMDFRLKIDYKDFVDENEVGRESLVFEILLRSLELLKSNGVTGSEMDRFVDDVRRVGLESGWASP